jgi:hypothetical protein
MSGKRLLRSYIADSLKLYFEKDVIISLPAPFNFGSFKNELQYRAAIAEAYSQNKRSWLTPVETFTPHYSFALANWAAKTHQKQLVERKKENHAAVQQPLHIVEIGGGKGTNAKNILDWFAKEQPQIYSDLKYTIFDVSETQSGNQLSSLKDHVDKCRFVVSGEGDWKETFSKASSHHKENANGIEDNVIIFALEVLDNLPHDKLVTRDYVKEGINLKSTGHGSNGVKAIDQGTAAGTAAPADSLDTKILENLYETHVVENNRELSKKQGFKEVYAPIQDELVLRTARYSQDILLKNLDHHNSSSSSSSLNNKSFMSYLKDFLHNLGFTFINGSDGHKAAFIPTGCLKLLEELHQIFPRHVMLLADFNYFLPPDLEWDHGWKVEDLCNFSSSPLLARNAPFVSTRDDKGGYYHHPTYLNTSTYGRSDIVFATNFDLLKLLYEKAAAASCQTSQTSLEEHEVVVSKKKKKKKVVVTSEVFTSKEFMVQYSDHAKLRAADGFNPLLVDFTNTRVFVGQVK